MKLEPKYQALQIPAYGLYYVDTLEEMERSMSHQDYVKTFESEYDEELRKKIIESLEWIVDFPKKKLPEILPNLPHTDDFKREYFRITLRKLKEHQNK